MIKPTSMTKGLVFRDPKHGEHAPSRQFFKVLNETDSGPWQAINLASNAKATFMYGDLNRLHAAAPRVFCEVDFSALLGARVRIDLKFGSKSTGIVQEVRSFHFAVDGKEFEVPKSLIIASEEIPIDQIAGVSVLASAEDVE